MTLFQKHPVLNDSLDFQLNSVYDHAAVNFIEPADVLIQPKTVADIPQPTKDVDKHKDHRVRKCFILRSAYSPRPKIRVIKPKLPVFDNIMKGPFKNEASPLERREKIKRCF